MWKKDPETRIKPVIARDTTYCVSLLTGTTGGSNFAIPSTKIPAPREWAGIQVVKGSTCGSVLEPEVTRRRRRQIRLRRPGFRSVSPAPEPQTQKL